MADDAHNEFAALARQADTARYVVYPVSPRKFCVGRKRHIRLRTLVVVWLDPVTDKLTWQQALDECERLMLCDMEAHKRGM